MEYHTTKRVYCTYVEVHDTTAVFLQKLSDNIQLGLWFENTHDLNFQNMEEGGVEEGGVEEGGVEELTSAVTKCVMCKVGRVSIVGRSRTKADLVVYGRSGMRLARHLESRCMVHTCRAGYYHGYMTYKGHTVFEDHVLKVFTFRFAL